MREATKGFSTYIIIFSVLICSPFSLRKVRILHTSSEQKMQCIRAVTGIYQRAVVDVARPVSYLK